MMNKLPDIFQALGNNVRFKIITVLTEERKKAKEWRGMCVCDIIARCNVANSTMTHHLDWLRSVGLLHSEKRGKWIYFDVNQSMIDRLIKEMEKLR